MTKSMIVRLDREVVEELRKRFPKASIVNAVRDLIGMPRNVRGGYQPKRSGKNMKVAV